MNMVINLQVPYSGKFLNSYTIGGFSRRAQFHEVRGYDKDHHDHSFPVVQFTCLAHVWVIIYSCLCRLCPYCT
jgi:hypothetical protein